MNQPTDGQSSEQPTPQIDADLEREIAEALGGANVEELMQAADTANQPAAPSDKPQGEESIELDIKRGRIVSISGEDVFVDLTGVEGKNQGVVPLAQFDRPPRDGSIMDFVVDRFDDSEGLYILSREGAVQAATWDHIHNGATVEARVTGTNKGGLELEMVGGINAFMPASLVDIHRIDDLETMVGQKIHARVQEIDRKNKRILISRRHHLEAERKAAQDKAWKTLEPGMIIEGTVDNIMDYGAFVDIGGGVDGLVHISDMSYGHINKPSDAVKKGQKVQVKVISLDKEKNRIKLGLKQVQPDPWEGIADRLAQGTQIRAKVVRVADFGAFVELEPGVEGLLPGSEMSWKRGKVDDAVKVGDEVTLSVLQVDESKRRVSLSLKQVGGDPWLGAEAIFAVHSVVEATVRSITDFGAFVEVTDGIEGLVHISELSDQRVNKVEDVLKVGDTKKFRILEIDETERKIRLSLKQVDKLAEPSESKGKPRGGGRGGRGGGKRDDLAAANTVQSRNKRGERVIEFTPKKKDKGGDAKGGMGDAGGMGTGLGGLSLGDLEP